MTNHRSPTTPLHGLSLLLKTSMMLSIPLRLRDDAVTAPPVTVHMVSDLIAAVSLPPSLCPGLPPPLCLRIRPLALFRATTVEPMDRVRIIPRVSVSNLPLVMTSPPHTRITRGAGVDGVGTDSFCPVLTDTKSCFDEEFFFLNLLAPHLLLPAHTLPIVALHTTTCRLTILHVFST